MNLIRHKYLFCMEYFILYLISYSEKMPRKYWLAVFQMNSFRLFLHTVLPLLISATQKCVIPKEKVMLCLFFFGITNFWGAGIDKGNTVFVSFFSCNSLELT